jgi:hypothetical protein
MMTDIQAAFWGQYADHEHNGVSCDHTEMAEWLEELEGLGVKCEQGNSQWHTHQPRCTAQGLDADSVQTLAELLGWRQAETWESGDGCFELYRADEAVIVCWTNIGAFAQIIPAAEFDEWEARHPEWSEPDEE